MVAHLRNDTVGRAGLHTGSTSHMFNRFLHTPPILCRQDIPR